MEFEFVPNKNLSGQEVARLRSAMMDIQSASKKVGQPADPCIEHLLEMAHSLLSRQITLDMKFEWDEPAKPEDRFLDTSDENIMSPEELRRMMEGE